MKSSIDDLGDARPETPMQRADRKWNDILQELRVPQTGTQILAGVLLALAFRASSAELEPGQRVVCLGALALVSPLLVGAVTFVFDVVAGCEAAVASGIVLDAIILVLWVVVLTIVPRR